MKHWLYKSGWRLLPGLLGIGVTLIAARMGVLKPLEHSIYRALFHIRGEQPWDDRVTVIEIDEASLAAIGQFPWPRHYYIDLLEQLAPAQASVVAFDILFADTSTDDEALALAMAKHGDIVLATAWDEQGGVIGPNANVIEGAIATGHIHHNADADGITRAYNAKINGASALSLAAVQRYSQKQTDDGVTFSRLRQNQTLWLNWRGFAQNAPRYSFVEVLNGKVPATTFTNKIVFIGFTGVGLDVMTTPYNNNPPAAGVYQHVVAANNLLAQNHLQPITAPIWVIVLLCCPVIGHGLFYCRLKVQLLRSLTIGCAWCGLVIVAFSQSYWFPAVVPVVSIATTTILVVLAERLQIRLKLFQWADAVGYMPFRLHPSLEPPFGGH